MDQNCVGKKIRFHTIAVILLAILALHPNAVSSQCAGKKTCEDCIQTKEDCIWCTDPDFPGDRCTPRTEENSQCKSYENVKSTMAKIKNEPTISSKLATPQGKRSVHISPQKVQLELKVGSPITVQMEYLDAEDKALDLYYLVDLSHTMKDDRETVAAQSEDLAIKLKKITQDVQFGFGSFVDKPVMPFASTTQLNYKDTDDTLAPYSFRNHLSLTNNTAEFARQVRTAKSSTNLDEPEGSLDAIMQAIACVSEIGWRNHSRKLLIMSTDGSFHIAGDGKLGGIVIPNDMKCHLENNRYTHEKILDYPSIGQLNAKVKEMQVNVIFAVTKPREKLYDLLSERIDSSKTVILENNSNNVVDVIRGVYKTLVETLELNQQPERVDDLRITYNYNCDGSDNNHEYSSQNKPKCANIAPGEKRKFDITFELSEHACNGGSFESEVDIYPFALREEKLTISIKGICDCPCGNKLNSTEIARAKCSGFGNLTCGVCACDANRGGEKCFCDISSSNVKTDDDSGCKDEYGTICSGRGNCVCGKCECNRENHKEVFDGERCEYDRRKCRTPGSEEICSGHGTCEKEKCQCGPKYEGAYCNCDKHDLDNCKEPGSDKICNDQGSCACHEDYKQAITKKRCRCEPENPYRGAYCHICETCAEQSSTCRDLAIENCINCLDKAKALEDIQKESSSLQRMTTKVMEIGSHFTASTTPADCKVKCEETKTLKNVSFILNVQEQFDDQESEGGPSVSCEYKSEDKCRIHYRYTYMTHQNQGKYLKAQVIRKRNDECPTTPWWIIGAVVGSILLIGILLLLVWKIVTHIHDAKEYQRFEKEREGTKFGVADNPLYTGPTSQFVNPLRNRRSVMPEALAQSSH